MRRSVAIIVSIILFLLSLPAPTTPAQPSQIQLTLTPSDDTFVQSDRPDDTNGASNTLEVRYRTQRPSTLFSYALLKFNLTQLPTDAAIATGELELTASAVTSPFYVAAFRSSFSNWTESTVAWKSAEYASIDSATTPTPSDRQFISANSVGKTTRFNVTEYVQLAGGERVLTLLLKPVDIEQSGSSARTTFYSKESATGNAPKLLVWFTPPVSVTTQETAPETTTWPGLWGLPEDLLKRLMVPAVTFAIVAAVVAFILMRREGPMRETPPASVPTPAPAPIVTGPKLTRTGTKALDEVLNGGLPPRSTVLMISEFTDVTDGILTEFVTIGCAAGNFGLYVTSRERPYVSALLDKLPSLAVLVGHPSPDSLYVGRPRVVRSQLSPNPINIARVQVERNFIRSKSAPKFAAIDLLSPLLIENEAKDVRFWLSEFLQKLKALNFTTIASMNPRMHDPADLAVVADVFDGEIEIVKGAHDDDKYIVVKRFADHDYQKKPVKM